MNQEQLFEQIRKKKSFLCIGLNPDIEKIPNFLSHGNNPLLEFNEAIIGATREFAIAYTLNLAFYARHRAEGIHQLEITLQKLKTNYSDLFVIADAKYGDTKDASMMYAKSLFDSAYSNYDAVTVNPYMGRDSVEPFLEYPDKSAILLALTANEGAQDFQTENRIAGSPLYLDVICKSKTWKHSERLMYAVSPAKAETLGRIRELIPNSFLLISDVGVQGRSLEEVAMYGMNKQCGLMVEVSRDIIYAGEGPRFWESFKDVAWKKYQQPMETLLRKKGLL